MIKEESNKKNELAIKKEQEFEVIKNELIKTIETEIKVFENHYFQQRKENDTKMSDMFEDKLSQIKANIEKQMESENENLSYLKNFFYVMLIHTRINIFLYSFIIQ